MTRSSRGKRRQSDEAGKRIRGGLVKIRCFSGFEVSGKAVKYYDDNLTMIRDGKGNLITGIRIS